MNSRYGSQLLSVCPVDGGFVGDLVRPESVVTCMAGFATLGRLSVSSRPFVGLESVVTSMAGFAVRTQPGARTWMPAVLRYALAVSRRTPMTCSMRRKDQPRRPKAIICCRLSSLNTLLMPLQASLPRSVVNVPDDFF